MEKSKRYEIGLITERTTTNQESTQRLITMCDNTAPYTAREVHLVTTKFKIVDKYTVEYKCITVLTQAQSSLKHREKIHQRQDLGSK